MNIHRFGFIAASRTKKAVTKAIVAAAFLVCVGVCAAQTTAFTYQGRLTEASMPATGTYDFQFALYDAAGTLITSPAPIVRTGVAVTNGAFVVQLDFGTAGFPSADRYLEVRVKRPTDPSYIALTPRQRITSTPYAIRANNSTFSEFATFASSAGNAQTATSSNSATTATTAGNVTGVVAIANGGTGSSTKNFVDLGPVDQFVGGTKTFGNAAGNGANLENVVVMTSLAASFAGQSIPNSASTWSFLGQPAILQINSGQKLSVTGTVFANSFPQVGSGYRVDICRRGTNNIVTPFGGALTQAYNFGQGFQYSYSYGDVTLSPAIYEMGLCANNINSGGTPAQFTGVAMGFAIVAR